ncbi:MAG: peroxiredoxin [Phycisphaerales bacterium]|nr:peroxiredoxin [Phycisphaerales bacterium]MCI0629783.1 peroxiredoxin [Phycisphaerales bacterium]MCI0676518.1 peroxiredoxin [Phycisphaerales bacterium]
MVRATKRSQTEPGSEFKTQRSKTRQPNQPRIGERRTRIRRNTANGSAGALQPGTRAPKFDLNSTPDQRVDLNHFRGRPVVLVFYPADWSPVCGDQLALYNELHSEFNKHAAQLLGISVDSAWCHTAYAQSRNLHFPLLADFEPKGEVARRYGVYREGDGLAERALFVIDADGIIRWSYVSPLGVNPGADGILQALEEIDANRRQAVRQKEQARARES